MAFFILHPRAIRPHIESTFEQALVEHLTQHGWHASNPKAFNCELAMDTASVLDFVQRTQPDEWKKLSDVHGLAIEERFIQRLVK